MKELVFKFACFLNAWMTRDVDSKHEEFDEEWMSKEAYDE